MQSNIIPGTSLWIFHSQLSLILHKNISENNGMSPGTPSGTLIRFSLPVFLPSTTFQPETNGMSPGTPSGTLIRFSLPFFLPCITLPGGGG